MALLDTIELRLHFDELTNLDLLKKGLYRIQATIEWSNTISATTTSTSSTPSATVKSSSSAVPTTLSAIPYTCVAHPLRLTSVSKGIECIDSDLGSEPGTIDDQTLSYVTRSVYMRYTDEQFDLNEWISFRLSIPRNSISPSNASSNTNETALFFPWDMDTRDVVYTDERLFLAENESTETLTTNRKSDNSSKSITTTTSTTNASIGIWNIHLILQRADCTVIQVPPLTLNNNNNTGQSASLPYRSGFVKEEVQRTSNYVPVSTRTLSFPHSVIMNGLHSYMPIVWDSMNLAGAGVTIESSFVNSYYETPVNKPPEITTVPFFGQPRERLRYIRSITNNTSNASNAPTKGSTNRNRTRTVSSENPTPTTDNASVNTTGTGKRSWTERWSSGITTAAIGLASIVLSPPSTSLPSFSSVSSSFVTPGTSTAIGSAISFFTGNDTPIDRHLDGLTNECKDYIRTLSAYEHFPLTSTEAYFPYIFQQRCAWRTNRRRQLVAALRLLEQTALDDNQENSAAEAAAQEIVQDTLRTLHVPFIASTLPEDQVYVTETELTERYIYLLSPFFYNYYRLSIQLHKLSTLPDESSSTPPPTTMTDNGIIQPSLPISRSLSFVPSRFSKGVCTHALDLYNHLHRQHHHSHYVRKSETTSVSIHPPSVSPSSVTLSSVFQTLVDLLPSYSEHGTECENEQPASNGGVFLPPSGDDAVSFLACMTSVARYFVQRAKRVQLRPDNLARCIQHDIQIIAEEVNTIWRTVQRETSVHMRHILTEGQVQYRTLALLHVSSAITYHIIPPAGMLDPRASQRNSQIIHKSLPCKHNWLLDPILTHVPQILDVTVSIVGHSPVLPLHSRSTRKIPFQTPDDSPKSPVPERLIRGRLPSYENDSIAVKRPYLQILAIHADQTNDTNNSNTHGSNIPSPLQEEGLSKRKGLFQVNPNGAKLGKTSSVSSQDEQDTYVGVENVNGQGNTRDINVDNVMDTNVSEGGPSPLSDNDGTSATSGADTINDSATTIVPMDSDILPTDTNSLIDIPLFGSDVKSVRLPFSSNSSMESSSSSSASSTSSNSTSSSSSPKTKPVHVIFFLNGLGGSMHDSRIIRSQLKLHHPHLFISVTVSNQGKSTEGDLVEAGVKVAHEMYTYLSQKLPDDGLVPTKLSIIAFSLGGIVARIALRHPILTSYLPLGYAFISIATPHLGVLYSSSVFSTGLYVLRQLRSSVAMGQLALNDEPGTSIRNSLLYLLTAGWNKHGNDGATNDSTVNSTPSSTDTGSFSPTESLSNTLTELTKGDSTPPTSSSSTAGSALTALRKYNLLNISNGMLLDHFQKILLLASPQDSYAPFASCMAQICDEALNDKKHGNVYTEMVQAFYSGLTLDKVRKVSVKFFHQRKGINLSMDSLIGREAHVSFLDNEQMAAFISLGFDNELWDCTHDEE